MLEKENFASLIVQARDLTRLRNALASAIFVQAANNWALNRGVGPVPVAQRYQEITAEEAAMGLIVTDLDGLVSDLDPRSLLPKFATDDNPVGGRVGGPIKGQPGKFYLQSGSRAMHGDKDLAGGAEYEFRAPFFGLGGYWVKL